MTDYLEVSYTGDLLAHRRCARAWAYEKHVGFRPYEQVQAMEGRLIHHAMEWLTRFYRDEGRHATATELDAQLNRHFRILWARGVRTAFTSKADTLARVMANLYPNGQPHPIVQAAIEGAQHTEYELRAVRKLLPADFGGKTRVMLTGILDLVVQEQAPLRYERSWQWDSLANLEGHVSSVPVTASTGDIEIWDYKGSRAGSEYLPDYVRQVLTYAALYRDRAGELPIRCVLYFVYEPDPAKKLLAIDVDDHIVAAASQWTLAQVKALHDSQEIFEANPTDLPGGPTSSRALPVAQRVTDELATQCTACGQRFNCAEYGAYLRQRGRRATTPPDVDIRNVLKN